VLSRALAQVVALPFASPSAFVLAEAELPESREMLVLAHDDHREIARAIEAGEGSRAEAVAREHARLARRNLEIVIANRDALRSIPGHGLLELPER
jgi:GntR family transcriptional regulator of vanillate catabolism